MTYAILQSKKNHPAFTIILFKYEHIYIQKNLTLIIQQNSYRSKEILAYQQKNGTIQTAYSLRKALTWGKKLRLLIKKLFNKLTSGISRNNMIAMS